MITRRKFTQLAGASLAALTVSPSITQAFAEKRSLGVQLFTIPQMAANDFKGTLQLLSKIGYKEVEFFGPYDFSAPQTIEGWKGIAAQLGIKQNAFYGYSLAEVKSMMSDLGLRSPSVHLDLPTLRQNMGPAMEALVGLGVKYVAIPALQNPVERATLSDYKKLAAEFSMLGEKMSKYGITFTYHNHGYEHALKDGMVPMDVLLTETDKRYVAFELDIFWMKAGGGEPVEYFKKYPDRYKLMHIKDAKEPVRFAGDGGSSDQWIALFPKMTDPGTGVFNLKEMIATAEKSGVQHFFLERDLTPDPKTTLNSSFGYLSGV
ncbi:MAG: sugar phosphate isomerase/epimerase [Cyclobacteriaceae bacterium]|nr:sugar phosphate isomerase/epimerase [Cyclobacteriaceae bacterium]